MGVIRILIYGATSIEVDEAFLVAFTTATNADIGGYLGLGFAGIADDD